MLFVYDKFDECVIGDDTIVRHPKKEEIKISEKLCDEADTLSKRKAELIQGLKEIIEEGCHGFTWIT